MAGCRGCGRAVPTQLSRAGTAGTCRGGTPWGGGCTHLIGPTTRVHAQGGRGWPIRGPVRGAVSLMGGASGVSIVVGGGTSLTYYQCPTCRMVYSLERIVYSLERMAGLSHLVEAPVDTPLAAALTLMGGVSKGVCDRCVLLQAHTNAQAYGGGAVHRCRRGRLYRDPPRSCDIADIGVVDGVGGVD